MRQNKTVASTIFDVFNHIFLGIWAIITVLPFLYVLAASFAPDSEIKTRTFFIIPHNPTLLTYKFIFASNYFLRSMLNSVIITVGGTLVNLFFTFTMAYALSKKHFIGRSIVLNGIIFTMLFGGGMIPTYLLVKSLGLLNSYWALWLPGAISPFNFFVVKNFFQEMPQDLEDAARIDGCTEAQVLWKIILPLSKPIIATFALFYGVGHWNSWFGALLYINDAEKWPVQLILRQIVMLSTTLASDLTQFDPNFQPPQESLKMAIIVVATLPIMLLYPWLQKYFIKGMFIGSLKE
ncbi:putative aldouronate transport system permease protein [Caldicellulosiruptor bescii]|jgi:putative aldouronate transport system permease protein|uniref:Binding-protein-dependent transport systems inner membrane component n=2 Tax=Caldicellulosiruptor bescii TaxID=31899 RepID=B9MLU6_CALBD|nr:carbohydrate ABC transporter permease [Caldicellulosiruptor bescii]ACM61169.1 binding-protein-dependent transport systems inner membrane component [Caldicellulosiruptor bescii DSM 6725]PBC89018.1 putative aldouronate transport system permease protein [Caldicellulosiruptor bescii]PBC91500.1 putative aldouronate transport system permease protein [Caldicellulosiruptor bescii]PBD03088.1 putative aldouronate transport system permease protein [Caldicellulosiruptor bescii]PBD07298.1 putative aldou